MEIIFSPQEVAFRQEVRQFLAVAFDDELNAKLAGVEVSPHLKEAMVEWQNRLNQKNWLAPGWPVEYGGQDWTITQHFIFRSELGKVGAPPPMPFGVAMWHR